jgi:hypothetical protein
MTRLLILATATILSSATAGCVCCSAHRPAPACSTCPEGVCDPFQAAPGVVPGAGVYTPGPAVVTPGPG